MNKHKRVNDGNEILAHNNYTCVHVSMTHTGSLKEADIYLQIIRRQDTSLSTAYSLPRFGHTPNNMKIFYPQA